MKKICKICNGSVRELSLEEINNLSSLQRIIYTERNIFECNSSKTLTLCNEQFAPHLYLFLDNIAFLLSWIEDNDSCSVYKVGRDKRYIFLFRRNIHIKHLTYSQFETILNFG